MRNDMVSRIIIQYTDGSIHETLSGFCTVHGNIHGPLSFKTMFCIVHGDIYNDERYIYGNQTGR